MEASIVSNPKEDSLHKGSKSSQNSSEKLVSIVGSPNCGKTSLFNVLTGANQRVGNFPGITVDRKAGRVKGLGGAVLVDLPGLYSLDVHSFDEKVARDNLLGLAPGSRIPDLVLSVVDVTNLERSLYHVLELKAFGLPVVVALNLMDEARRRGLELDLSKLEEKLGVPVMGISASRREGIQELISRLDQCLKDNEDQGVVINRKILSQIQDTKQINENFQFLEQVLKEVTLSPIQPDTLTQRIDAIVLHPVGGVLVLLGSFFVLFQALFAWAEPLTGLLEFTLESVISFLVSIIPAGFLQSFVVDGVVAGVGNVLVFLPQILSLFFFILFLEDFGYLGRAAFLLNSFMRKLGLPGRAVVPLLSSHACAIPGIMTARTIENYQDRMVTIMVAPLTTCSARIPVFVVLIAALVPATQVWGGFDIRGLILFGLYLFAIASTFVIAFALRRGFFKGEPSTLLMELPPYRIPRARNIFKGLFHRAWLFIKKAGTVILVLSIVLWVLASFPQAKEGQSQLSQSYAAQIGKSIAPVFAPLGYDWKICTALIPAFGARELMVSSMATVMSVESKDEDEQAQALTKRMQNNYSIPVLLSLIAWFLFAPQCISTFGVLRRETDTWKWPLFVFVYMLVLSYLLALITYWGGLYFFPAT